MLFSCGSGKPQRCFLWIDLRTLIKFHVLLGKNALAYYKLKESLGTHAPSYETVHQWVNAIKNGQEKTDDASVSGAPTLATDECNVEQVKFVLEHMHSIICVTVATKVRICPANVPYPDQQLRETKSLCKVDSTSTLWWPKNHVCVLLASTHQQHG